MVNTQGVVSACLGYHGFPESYCISINEVVCHGIPSDEKVLKNGDIVNIDVTIIKDGYFGDNSKNVCGRRNQYTQPKIGGGCCKRRCMWGYVR